MSHTRQEIVRRNGLTLAHRSVDAFAANPADPYGGANQEIPIKPQLESSALPFSHRARTDELVHRSMRSLGFLLFGGLAAGCGWPVRTLTSCLVRMLAVQATKCGVCCPPFVKPLVA